VLSGTAAAVVPAASSPGNWSQADYDSAQSRANLTEHALTRTTVNRVRYLRSVVSPADLPPRQGCARNTIVTPVLTGGRMYAVANGRLTKYNPATGTIIWRHQLKAGNVGTSLNYQALSVADGLVVVGENSCDSVSDPNGFVQAFKATTGARVWSEPITPLGGALVQMVMSGAYVAAAGVSPGSGQVVSVRKLATGALAWDRVTNSCAPASVLVIDQLVISSQCGQNLAETLKANHLTTGARAWSRPGVWQIQRGNLGGATGGHLYATDPSGAIVDLNPATGTTQYTLTAATTVLAVDASQAYADCGSLGVCAYSTATGSRKWNVQPGTPTPLLAAEAGGVLYLDQGPALNSSTGLTITTLWSGAATALAIGNGRMAAVTDPRVLDLFGLPGS
jgi:outer membrane protein assembly factor BamB